MFGGSSLGGGSEVGVKATGGGILGPAGDTGVVSPAAVLAAETPGTVCKSDAVVNAVGAGMVDPLAATTADGSLRFSPATLEVTVSSSLPVATCKIVIVIQPCSNYSFFNKNITLQLNLAVKSTEKRSGNFVRKLYLTHFILLLLTPPN